MIDFWFDFASTYSYVGALRIEDAARAVGEQVRWKPFLLGPIFTAQLGVKTSPFNTQPVRGAYMWRDLERLCAKYGFPFQKPEVFPQRSILAARIALIALDQPWVGDFIRAVFRAEFGEGKDISSQAVLGDVLSALAIDPSPYFQQAETEPVKRQLRAFTDEAQALGIFGAPNVVVKDELFFGQDRIDDALEWAKTH
jgi:2-hydroxychromene-2-carboxylate isomerase